MVRSFLLLLKSLGILLAGFGAVFVVNLPHDWLLNAGAPGSAYEQVPLGPRAELLSLGLVFLAGAGASSLVGVLAGPGPYRRTLLLVLLGLFLLVDGAGVLTHFASTSLLYRLALVTLVPLEVWVGYRMAQQLKPAAPVGLGRN